MVGIYKITSPSGKVYIGQSWNIMDRYYRYKSGRCKTQLKLYNSLMKYGFENHKFEIIHELPNDCSQEDMNNYETLYYNQYKQVVELLNVREPGSNGKLSEETKQKLRDGDHSYKLGRKQSQETIDKRLSKTRGRKRTEEQRERMKQGRKGMKFSEEHRKNISLRLLGNKNAKKNDK